MLKSCSRIHLRSINTKAQSVSPFLVSIEGNIGAGKSTLLSELKRRQQTWTFIDEPLNFWSSLKNDDGKNLLETYYSDMPRWGFTFQVCGFQSRFRNIENIVSQQLKQVQAELASKAGEGNGLPQTPLNHVFITERCLDTDYQVFTKMLHKQGYINNMEMQIYEANFLEMRKFSTLLNGIVHLNTTPELCMKRIRERSRPGEEVISNEYLTALDDATTNWVSKTDVPVLTLGNCEVKTKVIEVEEFIKKIASQNHHTV